MSCLGGSKSSLLNYWTAVWVVLSEDGLEFYKKKTDQSPKGMIPLKGAAIISPCQDCGNRMVRPCRIHTHTHITCSRNAHSEISFHSPVGVQDHHAQETGSFLPSVACGGEGNVGEGHQEGCSMPARGQEVRQEVHQTLHSPARHHQPDVGSLQSAQTKSKSNSCDNLA